MYRAIFSALHAENMARNHRKLQCHIRMRRGEYVRYPHICWSSGQQRSHSALKGHTHLYYFDSNGGETVCRLCGAKTWKRTSPPFVGRFRSVRRRLPSRFFSGINGEISCHSASRRSLAYSRSFRRYCAGGFSPSHRDLIKLSKTHESQPAEISKTILGQTLS